MERSNNEPKGAGFQNFMVAEGRAPEDGISLELFKRRICGLLLVVDTMMILILLSMLLAFFLADFFVVVFLIASFLSSSLSSFSAFFYVFSAVMISCPILRCPPIPYDKDLPLTQIKPFLIDWV